MSLWEYKVITSGKGGFASPALLEKFLNDLGRDEWEIVTFQTAPDNFLAFTGLARRTTQRDWTLEDAAAAAAKAEAEKLRAEFEAKFKAANQPAPAEERSPSFIEEKLTGDDGFRKPVDTSRDDEPEAADDEKDDWDKLTAAEEDELPTFFEAIKPHMRRNQRGPGMSVGVEYLAKKWDQAEDDVKAALVECGFTLPADEDSKAEYLEYDGDLYWLNINRRGELWINTKEKPRQVFRSVKATKLAVEEEAPKPATVHAAPAEGGAEKTESGESKPEGAAPAAPVEGSATADTGAGGDAAPAPENRGGGRQLPEGPDLLRKIRPHMRRNRRGPGGSGSSTFLARALRVKEDDLKAAFVALGLTMPATSGDKEVYTEFGNELWWLNLDSRGGLWINGREKRSGETLAAANAAASADAALAGDGAAAPAAPEGAAAAAPTESAPAAETVVSAGVTEASPAPAAESAAAPLSESERGREVAPVPAPTEAAAAPSVAEAPAAPAPAVAPEGVNNPVLAGVRPLLKETRSGGIAGKVDRLAQDLGKSSDDLVATLVGAGLKVPEKPREKPVLVEHAGESFWLNRNGRGELWLNAKASKLAAEDAADEADDESAADGEGAEASEAGTEGGEGDAEKKPRRSRGRGRKSE